MWMGLFPSVEGLTRTKDWLPLSKREFCQQKDFGFCICQGSQEDQNKCDMKLYEEISYGNWLMWLWRLTGPWYVVASRTQFRIPENKIKCSMSAGRRTCRFQLKKRGRIHLPLPFYSVCSSVGGMLLVHFGRAFLFTHLTDSDTNLFQRCSQTHPEILSTNYQIIL